MKAFIAASLALIGLSAEAYATRWSGGGGEIIRDGQNPWWVHNTTDVNYCIMHDAEAFPLGAESLPLETIVKNALNYWQEQFKRVNLTPSPEYSIFAVATQKFHEVSCDDNADLRFQFGTLTPEQLTEAQIQGVDFKDFVSLALRTDYDRVNLKGKGFIYLAPTRGPP